jgi:hypothetical protein
MKQPEINVVDMDRPIYHGNGILPIESIGKGTDEWRNYVAVAFPNTTMTSDSKTLKSSFVMQIHFEMYGYLRCLSSPTLHCLFLKKADHACQPTHNTRATRPIDDAIHKGSLNRSIIVNLGHYDLNLP